MEVSNGSTSNQVFGSNGSRSDNSADSNFTGQETLDEDESDGTLSGAMERAERRKSRSLGDIAADADAKLMGKRQGAVADTQEGQEAKEELKEAQRKIKLKLKIDGQESEEEFDESTVAKAMQLQKTAYARLEEASKKEKAWLSERQEFMTKIAPILKDPHAWAREILGEEIRHESMSPEQRLAEQREYKIREYEAMEAQREQDEQKVREDKQTHFEMQRIGREINTALQEYGLPETPDSVRMIIDAHRRFDMPFDTAAHYVSQKYEEMAKNTFSKMTPEALERYLGKERIGELRKWDIERLKTSQGRATTTKPTQTQQPRQRQKILGEEAIRTMLSDRFGQ